jgi:hypothetical protein
MSSRALLVERYLAPAEFLAAAYDWLSAAEAHNNLVLSVARLLQGADHPFREPFYFATVKEGDRIVGCALRAPPDGLELTDLPTGAASSLVDSVAAMHPELPLVGGPQGPVFEFGAPGPGNEAAIGKSVICGVCFVSSA